MWEDEVSDEVIDEEPLPIASKEAEQEPDTYAISLHALTGADSIHTMRLEGHISELSVATLIDTGSSSNFLSLKLAKSLKLTINTSPSFNVAVANGERMS